MGYFRLKPECYLVMGAKRAMLHNLVEKKCIWLTEEAADMLSRAEHNDPIGENEQEFFKTLAAKGWGEISDKKVFVDKFRPFNVFNEKKFHKNTPNVEIAILQITNSCNMDCEFCGKTFCPSCLRYDNDSESLSLDEWKKVIDDISFYGLKAVVLTGGEPALCKDMPEIVDYLKSKNIVVTIHTNGLKKLDNRYKDCGKIISVLSEEGYFKVCENYAKEKNVTLMVYDKTIDVSGASKKGWSIRNCTNEQTTVKKTEMGGISALKFYARQTYEDCMWSKIAVSHSGDIYPCLGVKKTIGNIREIEMYKAIKTLVEEYWIRSVEKRDSKCSMCEFRYSCKSCSCYDAEKNCAYDVEEALWI